MKLSRNVLYIFILFLLAVGLLYGFIGFKKHSIRRQLKKAHAYYAEGTITNALECLHDVWGKAKNKEVVVETLYLLGKCYLSTNELEEARQHWEKLQEMQEFHDWDDECLFSLGTIADQSGNVSSAIESFEKLIKEYPQSDFADDSMWQVAGIYRREGKLILAKQMLDTAIENYPQSNLLSSMEKELGKVNVLLLFSPLLTQDSTEYVVNEGDTLIAIAQKYNTTIDLLKVSNNIKSSFIKPGDRLKAVTAKFSIVVDKTRNTLILKADEKMIKLYHVGTGTSGSTPAGDFQITNKLINPPWYKTGEGVVPYGDPKNILGTHWLGLNITGYGIHGTWEPESIGKQSSAGCIRMLNEDVEELFKIVPSGTPVTVVE